MVDAQTEAPAITRSASPTVRKLFDAIRESGSSEPDIADAAGVSHATLHYWRAGNRSPTIMLLEAVASVLGYNIELVKADHATVTPAEVGGLVQRLNGEADAFDRGSDETDPGTAALLREAATALAAKAAELSVQVEAKEHARRECERAEAQLAEANKALDALGAFAFWFRNYPELKPNPNLQAEMLADLNRARPFIPARRALEAQGGKVDG